MLFLKVPKDKGERIRKLLLSKGFLNLDYRIEKDDSYLYFPLKKGIKKDDVGADYSIVEKKGKKIEKRPSSIEEMIGVSQNTHERIVTYDIIGNIAIAEIKKGYENKEREIGEAIMRINPQVRSVYKKESPMEGIYRVRKLRLIAGEENPIAEYTEHGCRMILDASKVYFSVRLSYERGRIAKEVKKGERVLVMFAGVGPFALVIAKNCKDCKVVGIEINPNAVFYFRKNKEINKLENIDIYEGDVREIVPKKFKEWADRVLMPLPKSAEDFLDVALEGVKDGGIIHFYSFENKDNAFKMAEKKIRKACDKKGYKYIVLKRRIVRPFSPNIIQVVVDFKVKKVGK